MVVWQLRDGAYVEVASVVGQRSWTAESPFGVTVTPDALLR